MPVPETVILNLYDQADEWRNCVRRTVGSLLDRSIIQRFDVQNKYEFFDRVIEQGDVISSAFTPQVRFIVRQGIGLVRTALRQEKERIVQRAQGELQATSTWTQMVYRAVHIVVRDVETFMNQVAHREWSDSHAQRFQAQGGSSSDYNWAFAQRILALTCEHIYPPNLIWEAVIGSPGTTFAVPPPQLDSDATEVEMDEILRRECDIYLWFQRFNSHNRHMLFALEEITRLEAQYGPVEQIWLENPFGETRVLRRGDRTWRMSGNPVADLREILTNGAQTGFGGELFSESQPRERRYRITVVSFDWNLTRPAFNRDLSGGSTTWMVLRWETDPFPDGNYFLIEPTNGQPSDSLRRSLQPSRDRAA